MILTLDIREPLRLLLSNAGRDLLEVLETATTAAQALDRERGSIDKDGHGTGYAETIGSIALKLRGEVEGPKGRN